MNVHEFKKAVEESGCENLSLHFQNQTDISRILTRENFLFFEQTLNYLVTVVSSSVGKFMAIGGVPDQRAGGTNSIGHALDEDIFFPGFFMLWASSFNYKVNSYQIDIRPVAPEEKTRSPGNTSYTNGRCRW